MAEGKSFLLYFIQHNVTYSLRNVRLVGFQNHCWLFTYRPQPFHISLHFILNSNSVMNIPQISSKLFFCRPNGSQLKLCLKIAQLNFSYFAKIPPWLKIGGPKNQSNAKG